MKLVTFVLLGFVSASLSFADILASYLTKDSPYTPDSYTQENQAAPVGQLIVGDIEGGSTPVRDFVISNDVVSAGPNLTGGYLSQSPVLTGIVTTDTADKTFTVFSIFMSSWYTGCTLAFQSLSFNYSQLSQMLIQTRSAFPQVAAPALPVKFTLMAMVNGGEWMALDSISVAGGTSETPWILGESVKFDLTSPEIQAKLNGAIGVTFELRGELGEGDPLTYSGFPAFDNISVEGNLVPASVPEPSSALLGAFGLLPLFMRRRRQ